MKKIIVGLIFCGVFLITTIAYAVQPLKLFVDGKFIQPEVSAQLINGRVFVPVRAVAESLGAKVSWDPKEQAVYISRAAVPTDKITLRQWLEKVNNALKQIDQMRSEVTKGTNTEKRDAGYKASSDIDKLIKENLSYMPPDIAQPMHPNFIQLLTIERERYKVYADGIAAALLSNYEMTKRMVGTTEYLANRSGEISSILSAQMETLPRFSTK